MWNPFRKRKPEIKPIDELTAEEIAEMRASSSMRAVFDYPHMDFVPPEEPLSYIAICLHNQRLGLALRLMYCQIYHLNRRIVEMEKAHGKD